MLDDTRRTKIDEIIESLPLTERQRELAAETVTDMTASAADLIIKHHARLVDRLPAALEAIARVKGGGTKRSTAAARAPTQKPAPAKAAPKNPAAPAAAPSASQPASAKAAPKRDRGLRPVSDLGMNLKAKVLTELLVTHGASGRAFSKRAVAKGPLAKRSVEKNATQKGLVMRKQAVRWISDNSLVPDRVVSTFSDQGGRVLKVVIYTGSINGKKLEAYVQQAASPQTRERSRKGPRSATRKRILALFVNGGLAYKSGSQEQVFRKLEIGSRPQEENAVKELLEMIG